MLTQLNDSRTTEPNQDPGAGAGLMLMGATFLLLALLVLGELLAAAFR
jgi:hypothetical protein